jgi:hypothetical protein
MTLPSSKLLFASALLTLASVTGCTAPSTPYRYTGLVPAAKPLPFDGTTAPDGSLRVEGNLTAQDTVQKPYAQLHDTALRVPEVTGDGAVMLAAARGFELGVRGSYAAYKWSQSATVGTMPVPSRGPTYGFGPEVHGEVRFGRTRAFGIGFGGNVVWNSVPYAQWNREGVDKAACSPGVTCAIDQNGVRYALFTESRETHLTFTTAVVPSYAFGTAGEYGHVFASLGFTTGFQNDGFTNRPQNGSTITSSGLLFVPALGYGAHLWDTLHLSGMLFYPVTTYDSPIEYRVGGLFTVGVDFELWEGRERGWRRRQRHEATDEPYMHNVPLPERRPEPYPAPAPAPYPAPYPAPGPDTPAAPTAPPGPATPAPSGEGVQI